MAVSQKRVLPSKIAEMKARKRVKLADAEQEGGKSATKNPVHLDQLQWKEVSMPDRMEDYEGFFGLEEIDGVDVIKDDSSKSVQFLTKPTKNNAIQQAVETIGTDFTNNKSNDDPKSVHSADDWDGFDDGPTTTLLKKQKTKTKTGQPAEKTKTTSDASRKVKDKSKQIKQSKTQSELAFANLDKLTNVEEVDVSAWRALGLSPDTLSAISGLGFVKPTTIQEASIPLILQGEDVIGKASTGSGKTLAFGIPMLERFLELKATRTGEKSPLALILSPTRELAHQLNKHITALCSGHTFEGPFVVTLTGGLSLQKQRRLLKSADILIGTPGRLWEVISSERGLGSSLKQIQFLVLDEADRLLSEGHFKEVEDILNVLERKDDSQDDADNTEKDVDAQLPQFNENTTRQTLVFSATFDKGLQKKLVGKVSYSGANKDSMEYLLSKLNFKSETPLFIDTNPVKQLAMGLKEGLIECGAMEKDLYLYSILLHHQKQRSMVFVNSISAVRRITPFLENLQLPALALHSGMAQKARLRSVERFTEAKRCILITTDVAARGLDIPNVELVIHYHLPRAADMYVHRSGRTARAGQQGSSILICSPEEVGGVRRLVAKVHAHSASNDEDSSEAARKGYYIRTLDPDRKVIARLKPRATLAKKLADVSSAKQKQNKEDDFFSQAADDLGIDVDDEEFTKEAPGRRGRGGGRKEKEKQSREVSKGESAVMRAELKELLKQRINVGVSEKYITSGRVDVDELLRQQEVGTKTGEFLGSGTGFGLDEM